MISSSRISPFDLPEHHANPSDPCLSHEMIRLSLDQGRNASPHILGLPDEILLAILTYLDNEADKMVNIDRRGYLSQESFRAPEPPTEEQLTYISNFRLTCKKFSELGAQHQFLKVRIRFTKQDFKRLEKIASVDYLARNVRKLSYFVPLGFYYTGFYSDNAQPLQENPPRLAGVDLRPYIQKRDEQREIKLNRIDVLAIQKAFRAFTRLQHVQLLRRVDAYDERYIRLADHHEELRNWVDLNWVQACFYSIKTVAEAILVTESKCSRFSSPHLNSQSARMVVDNPARLGEQLNQTNSLIHLAMQLTCLELHFDNDFGWNQQQEKQKQKLLPFHSVLQHARNLEALHLGFPIDQPLELDLDEFFSSLKWEKLVALGIQGWVVTGDDIEKLTKRHREKLRGLRLRNVYLKGERRWPSVLCYLRNDMPNLEWVSLRRIAYENIALSGRMGFDMSDFLDSDTDDEGSDIDATPNGHDRRFQDLPDDHDGTFADEHEDEDNEADGNSEVSDSGTDIQAAHDPEFPAALLRQSVIPPCTCRSSKTISQEEAEAELGDFNSMAPIPNDKRRFWERWVVNSCALHGPDAG